MKGYALLLGALLTGIYGYAAQAAMAADLARARGDMAVPATPAADDRIWYGGMLAPVTVVGWRPQPSAISHQPSAKCKTPVREG